MICYHYYELTKQLTSNQTTSHIFKSNFTVNIVIFNLLIVIIYYIVNIAKKLFQHKKKVFEGFMRDGGAIQLREAIQEDLALENIEDKEEWKRLRLNDNEVTILRYIDNFLQRINVTMNFKDLEYILSSTIKQLQKLTKFNVEFLKKIKKLFLINIKIERFNLKIL